MLLPLKGRKIHYDIVGPDKAPTLCMTHSLASDSGMWMEQMAPLVQAGWRLLRIDMRGHGGSDPVAGDYTMDQLADDTAIVLEALEIGAVHYMGLSIGGMFGQSLALRHGHRLKSLLFCDTTPAALANAREMWAPRIKLVTDAGSLAPVADATMERFVTEKVRTSRPQRWKQLYDTILSTTPAGYLGCGAALQNFDYAAQLGSIRLPTLVVWGAEDIGTPPAENRRIVAAIPSAHGEEMANARHFPNVELPDEFNRIMMRWLDARR
jgi:3-oxoadipate enol-lactonase